jgi:hypothetical protein
MGEPTRPAPSRRRRWAVRLAFLVVAAVGLFAARGPMLRNAVVLLVADDGVGSADAVYAEGRGGKYSAAARLYNAGDAGRVLVGSGPPERVVALGLIPDRAVAGRDRMVRLGVSPDRIAVLGRPDWDVWDGTRRLGEWLRENPGATVVVPCERYESRRARVVADRLLGPDADRVRVRPVPYRRFDDADWWRTDDGRRTVVVESVRLAYTVIAGERSAPGTDWNPDAYEAALK